MRQASQSMQEESTKKSPSTFAGSLSANCATIGPFAVSRMPSAEEPFTADGKRPTNHNAFQQPRLSDLHSALHAGLLAGAGAGAAVGDAPGQPGLLRLVGLALHFPPSLLRAGRLLAGHPAGE